MARILLRKKMNKLELIKALLIDSDKEVSDFEVGGSEVKIVVLQRGWVFVGKFSQEGSTCKLTDAYNIRSWGTTKGLGELAEGGPIKDKTNLDKVNDVAFHELTSVVIIDCDDKIWKKVL